MVLSSETRLLLSSVLVLGICVGKFQVAVWFILLFELSRQFLARIVQGRLGVSENSPAFDPLLAPLV